MRFQVHPLVRPSVDVDVVADAAVAAAAAAAVLVVLPQALEAAAAPVGLVRDLVSSQSYQETQQISLVSTVPERSHFWNGYD